MNNTLKELREKTCGTATLENPTLEESDLHNAQEGGLSCMKKPLSFQDMTIITAGTALPAALLIFAALSNLVTAVELVMRHPVETLLQYGLLTMIPLGNYLVWDRLFRNKLGNSRRLGLYNGAAIGGSALVFIACAAALYLGTPLLYNYYNSHAGDAIVGACAALASLITSLHLMKKLSQAWETDNARFCQKIYSIAGVLLSFMTTGLSEARQTFIKVNEKAALSEDLKESSEALERLRLPFLDSETEIKRDIAAPDTGGLSGLFLGLNETSARKVFFALTSQPYEAVSELAAGDQSGDYTTSSAYDNYLARQVVGEQIKGLSLKRSQIGGSVNADHLTANLNWTFVLKNTSTSAQEARAELALPPGAVVSNMTLWMDGKPTDATITSTTQARGAYSEVVTGRRDPALVTYLGKGRVLLQCFPVQVNKETKVSLSMTVPLKLDSASHASMAMPRLVSTNFKAAKTHAVRLNSQSKLNLATAGLHEISNSAGNHTYSGEINEQEVKNAGISLQAEREHSLGAFAAQDQVTGGYAVETVKAEPNATPQNLVVVVDGSSQVKNYKDDLTKMLKKVSKLVPTKVLLADNHKGEEPEVMTVEEAIKAMENATYLGGHDNLPAVVKASQLASDLDQSAVLWVHGPQPAFNDEIYITTPGITKPTYYELALDDVWTNTSQFLKNHQDIGPMTPVMRSGKLEDDMNRFIDQWKPGGYHYSVRLYHTDVKPSCAIIEGQDALNLSTLVAAQNCKHLIASNKSTEAIEKALRYHLVTPLTSGVILENQDDYLRWGIRQNSPLKQQNPNQEASKLASTDSLSGFGNVEQARGQIVVGTSTGQVAIGTLTGGDALANSVNKPILQGATLGTISPQAEYTIVQGVNTAGTVRVNNLANVEAVMNISAIMLQILSVLFGAFKILQGAKAGMTPSGLRRGRTAIGIAIVAIGLSIPSIVTWFIQTARDSALFN